MARVLYLTHTGMAEPLGQSQVLGYLKPLSKKHDIHLVSFEKPNDFYDKEKLSKIRELCTEHGIAWTPRKFRQSPRYFSSVLNVFDLYRTALTQQHLHSSELIHARSYLPSLVASWVGRKRNIPFIFDMRALWPEELIGAGRVTSGGLVHKVLVKVERHCLKRAAHTVSLTNAAINYLSRSYPQEVSVDNFSVIPTCVDLEKFTLAGERKYGPNIIGCSGTVISGFFRIDLLGQLFAAASKRWPEVKFEVVSRDNPADVRNALAEFSVPVERLDIRSAKSSEMPEVHRGHDASFMFFTTNTGKLGSCPTRMGEALACGTPVVINPGIGDVGSIGQSEAGVVALSGESNVQIEACLDALEGIWTKPELAFSCRQSAEKIFALQAGVESYHRIYTELAEN